MASILVVDDEPKLREALSRLLEHEGFVVHAVETGREALELFEKEDIDLALLDVALPDMTGLDVLEQLRKQDTSIPCVFITAFGTVRSAVEAMRLGAFDYITKPFDNHDLLRAVARALTVSRLGQKVKALEQDLKRRANFSGILGESPGIVQALRVLAKAAPTDATVLLTGESGTGKELAARSLHRQSRRATGPFVPVNCAAIPPTLAESEFFGAEKGAFTDARETRIGYFEQAQRGTLFLDEVGELPIDLQAKLLRVLQEREVTKVGSRRAIAVDVRVVAATNRDLAQRVSSGQFREDLFWRLNVFPIHLPPLRDRLADLPGLTTHLIDRLNIELGTRTTGVAAGVQAAFAQSSWRGNVRELENVLRYAMIVADGSILGLEHFPALRDLESEPRETTKTPEGPGTLAEIVARTTERVERAAIESELKRQRGNRTATAAALGISRRTLFTKLRQFSLVEAEDGDENDR